MDSHFSAPTTAISGFLFFLNVKSQTLHALRVANFCVFTSHSTLTGYLLHFYPLVQLVPLSFLRDCTQPTRSLNFQRLLVCFQRKRCSWGPFLKAFRALFLWDNESPSFSISTLKLSFPSENQKFLNKMSAGLNI